MGKGGSRQCRREMRRAGTSHLNGEDGEGEKQDYILKAQGAVLTEKKHCHYQTWSFPSGQGDERDHTEKSGSFPVHWHSCGWPPSPKRGCFLLQRF